MITSFVSMINPIQVLVAVTFCVVVSLMDFRKVTHKLIFAILLFSLLNEIVTIIMIVNRIDYSSLYSFSAIIHNTLWLLLLRNVIQSKILSLFTGVYIVFAIINLYVLEGMGNFNNYTFVSGGFLYVLFFTIESFRQLKNENLDFFMSNDFLLLFSPILFFLGLSFYFGFENSALGDVKIIGDVQLYGFIIYIVNIVYYLSIILFITFEKREKWKIIRSR